MLEVVDLHAGYGPINVVHGISFTVPDHSVFAVMGHNGAGKTTLLKTLLGLLPTRSGTITFGGEDITKTKTYQRVAKGMAYVPQGQLSFPQLSTFENLQLVADGRANGAAKIEEMFTMFPALKKFETRKAGLLSGGQRQQLSIARALITEPQLIILDEPTEGIQPNIVAEIEELVDLAGRVRAVGAAGRAARQLRPDRRRRLRRDGVGLPDRHRQRRQRRRRLGRWPP